MKKIFLVIALAAVATETTPSAWGQSTNLLSDECFSCRDTGCNTAGTFQYSINCPLGYGIVTCNTSITFPSPEPTRNYSRSFSCVQNTGLQVVVLCMGECDRIKKHNCRNYVEGNWVGYVMPGLPGTSTANSGCHYLTFPSPTGCSPEGGIAVNNNCAN